MAKKHWNKRIKNEWMERSCGIRTKRYYNGGIAGNGKSKEKEKVRKHCWERDRCTKQSG